jgi:hypothetical protein
MVISAKNKLMAAVLAAGVIAGGGTATAYATTPTPASASFATIKPSQGGENPDKGKPKGDPDKGKPKGDPDHGLSKR